MSNLNVLWNKPFFLFAIFATFHLASNPFEHSYLWPQIQKLNAEKLEAMVCERQLEIQLIKEDWKEKIPKIEDPKFLDQLKRLLEEGTLTPIDQGCGSTYLLLDQQKSPRFVIKPFDEDILCLNNPKGFASPFNQKAYRVRNFIPLYRSFKAEALASTVASLLNLNHLIPQTHLAIIKHTAFFNLFDPCEEKLCTVQTFLPNIVPLDDLAEKWLAQNLTEKELCNLVDQEELENLFLLIWILYDTDAHPRNFYGYREKETLFLCKIDNGLTFPNENRHLVNSLSFLPQSKKNLSEKFHKQIEKLPIDAIVSKIKLYEMEEALSAFYERIAYLQKVHRQAKNLRELDHQMRYLDLESRSTISSSETWGKSS